MRFGIKLYGKDRNLMITDGYSDLKIDVVRDDNIFDTEPYFRVFTGDTYDTSIIKAKISICDPHYMDECTLDNKHVDSLYNMIHYNDGICVWDRIVKEAGIEFMKANPGIKKDFMEIINKGIPDLHLGGNYG